RASIRSLEHLRDRIINALHTCNRSKIRLLTMTLVQALTKRRQTFHSMNHQTQTLIDDSLTNSVTTTD
ncbi:unnamed protein product, partial [Rotaria magnacalcarata]